MAEESIKNCLLVLDSMDIFGRSGGGGDGDNADHRATNALWTKTWEQLDKVDPQLKSRVFPETKGPSGETSSPLLETGTNPAAESSGSGEAVDHVDNGSGKEAQSGAVPLSGSTDAIAVDDGVGKRAEDQVVSSENPPKSPKSPPQEQTEQKQGEPKRKKH
ncbi:hypothetical protein EV175_006755, partial [Coemansia sp. RSA 1933]